MRLSSPAFYIRKTNPKSETEDKGNREESFNQDFL